MGFWKDLFAGWNVEPEVRPPPAPHVLPGTRVPSEVTAPTKAVHLEALDAIDEALAERLRKVAFVAPDGTHTVVTHAHVAPVVLPPVVLPVVIAMAAPAKPVAAVKPKARMVSTPRKTAYKPPRPFKPKS